MQLLDETSGLEALRAMLSEVDDARLAVAFWGRGAIEALGLDRPNLRLKLLCNLDSGACNPDELRRLLALPGVQLRSHPALHAKIYWTPDRAVLGSSNASANGLAVEGQTTGWREANLLVEDAAVVREIGLRFEALFSAGYDVELEHIDRCAALWDARARLKPTSKRLARTLFDAFAASPDHEAWTSVKVAFCRDPLDTRDEDWLADEIKADRISADMSAYAEWNDQIQPGDVVIEFWHGGRAATAQGLWLAEASYAAEKRGMRLVREVEEFLLPGLGLFAPTKAERAALAGLKAVVLRLHSTDGGRNAILDLGQAMALLNTATSRPDPKAFDQAMQHIYDEATAFGYRPTYLLKMLGKHGGVEAARLLIRGSATSGFDRLWEEKRLDLSVEALILQPEWQGLFNEDDKKAARRRLQQYGYRVSNADTDLS